VLDMPIDEADDPIDGIELQNLEGWTRYDSDRMRPKNNDKQLGGDQGRRRSNFWIRLGND